MPIPVILDTDPGIDDAIALMLAVASPEIDLLGVTTVAGNSSLANTTRNARRLLHLVGRDDIPVGVGASGPLVAAGGRTAELVHGDDGLGGITLPEAPGFPRDVTAVDLMVELVAASAAPVTLVAIGPLTNVALLAALHPDTFARVGRLVVMGGGARVIGNMTPAAEFNMWCDPEAAARVFASGADLTMVGLDVTQRATTTAEDWAPLHGGGRVGAAVLAMADFYAGFYRDHRGLEETAQHDSLAVASVIDPSLLTLTPCHVDVECAGTFTRGMTVVDLDHVGPGEPNAQVAVDVDAARFRALLLERVIGLDAALSNEN